MLGILVCLAMFYLVLFQQAASLARNQYAAGNHAILMVSFCSWADVGFFVLTSQVRHEAFAADAAWIMHFIEKHKGTSSLQNLLW